MMAGFRSPIQSSAIGAAFQPALPQKSSLSFSPGFSPLLAFFEGVGNRFNGLGVCLERPSGKPLKRLRVVGAPG